jgi:hypothetical protein
MKMMLHTPRATVFNTSSNKGMGIKNPFALYHTTNKIVNMTDAINTSNKYCNLTTRETLAEIRRATGVDVLRPNGSQPNITHMHKFPLHYMDLAKSLNQIEGSIHMQPTSTSIFDVTLESFTKLDVSQHCKKQVFRKWVDAEHLTLAQALPTLVGDERRWNYTMLGYWMSRESQYTHTEMKRDLEADFLGWCEPQHAKLLANTTVRAVERYRDYPEEIPVIDQEMKHLMVDPYYDMFSISTGEWATDGSAKHESTGYGMNTKVQGGIEKYHKMPGKQTINRGEALAVLHSLLDTRLSDPLVIYCDSQTTTHRQLRKAHATTHFEKGT